MRLKSTAALAAALSLAAMPAALAQTAGGAPPPRQRITMNATAGNEALLMLSPATVRCTQQELNRLGYSAGRITGSIDRATVGALTEFQRAHGLEPNGTIDETTLRALGVNPLRGMTFARESRGAMNSGGMNGGGMMAENGGAMANGAGVMNGEAEGARGGYGYGDKMNRGYGEGMNGGYTANGNCSGNGGVTR